MAQNRASVNLKFKFSLPMNNPENISLKMWHTSAVVDINTEQIKQEISQQDAELLNLLASDDNSFRLLTGSV